MSTATDTCPGCGREFAPRGFSNHLRHSRDPRCVSARIRLPAHVGVGAHEQEPSHLSPGIDVDMADIDDAEFMTPSGQSNQTGTADVDMDHGDNGVHPQSTPEEAPDVVMHPSDAHQTSVIFDSDAEESDDDDCHQDQMGPETERSKSTHTIQVFSTDRDNQSASISYLRFQATQVLYGLR